MSWSFLRRWGVLPLLLLLSGLGYWLLHSHSPAILMVGYVGDRSVTLWSTLAQVRQPITELHYGDRVEVLTREGQAAQVRTPSGALGWFLDSRQVMDAQLWQRSAELTARARSLPAQAYGATKAPSNARVEPGRDGARIYQFPRGTFVSVFERAVRDAPQVSDANSDDKDGDADTKKAKQEDWLLVMHSDAIPSADRVPEPNSQSRSSDKPSSAGPVSSGPGISQSTDAKSSADLAAPTIAGWVLARFIEPDLPGPVRDYATAANLHVMAYFELNRVPDGAGGEAPQYLAAVSRGGEGGACDFSMLRVYTWDAARKRYETAYVESNLCGRMPIRVSNSASGPAFRFSVSGESAPERIYQMQQTSVRRIKTDSSRPGPRK